MREIIERMSTRLHEVYDEAEDIDRLRVTVELAEQERRAAVEEAYRLSDTLSALQLSGNGEEGPVAALTDLQANYYQKIRIFSILDSK